MKPLIPQNRSVLLRMPARSRRRERAVALFLLLWGVSGAAQTRLVLNSGTSTATIAGNGNDARTTAGNALTSGLGAPRSVVYDTQGNLFLVDSRNNQISRLKPDGQLTIVAGTGQEGFAGDNGPATAALLNRPSSIVLLPDSTILVADTGNHRIRSISPSGIITTIAGTGIAGNAGDNGPAVASTLRNPAALILDADNTLLIADAGNHRIRRINAAGVITAVAGNGKEGNEGDGGAVTQATFLRPAALLLLPDKRILIADAAAHRIRALTPDGTITAFDAATLRRPEGMTLDSIGNLLVADADLQQLLQVANGGYTILAGNNKQGAATGGTLNSPSSAAVDSSGGVAIADMRNHQVQHVALPVVAFGAIPAGAQSASQNLLLQNAGNEPLHITSIALNADFSIVSGGTCGSGPITLAAHATCSLQIAFAPKAQGPAKLIGLVQLLSGPPTAVLLTGTGTPGANLAASSTALTSNGAISYSGSPVQFTAAVTGPLLAPPTGTVTIQDGATSLATLTLTSGKATTALSSLTVGQHTLRAVYAGDANYTSSTSALIMQIVVSAPDFSLSTPATSYSGSASGTVTIPISVLPLNGSLNHPATIAISGLPTGSSATFLPATFTLAGDPVAVTLLIKLPATLASSPASHAPWIAAALLLIVLPFRRKRAPALLLMMGLVSTQGCGGFRATSTSTSSSTTHRYTCILTVTTTGVLGDTLTHTTPLELDLTQ